MITDARATTTLSVSVVLHESPLGVLDECLAHLARSLAAAQAATVLVSAEVTLRDNRSSDDYRQGLQLRHRRLQVGAPPWLRWRLQLSDTNPGFGAAHNAALADSNAAFVLVLNPDVEMHDAALVQGLAFLGEHPDVAAVNPHCRRDDGRREYLCKRYPSVAVLLLRGFGGARLRERFDARLARYECRDLDAGAAAEVELLSGACLLCRRDAFVAVGGFDERFFLYFEDFDLSLRLARRGSLAYLPAMQALHHGGFAARKGWRHRRLFAASAWRFFTTHGWRLR